jgi:hypothetical protein
MIYGKVEKLKDEHFRRATGVKREVFEKMVEAVNQDRLNRKTKRGKISKFSIEDQILIMLEYYREYTTLFHMSVRLGIAESSVCRIVNKIENILIKCSWFKLPSKQEMSSMEIETIVVDATEIEIQKPKKIEIK